MKNINLSPVMGTVFIVLLSACNDNNVVIEEEELKVFSSGDKIHYSGDISQSGFEKIKTLMRSNTTTLVINSRGGDIVPSMKLGEFVFENKLNVQVRNYCFSSCANYIFPAGKTKYISKGSQLGWHGGATQSFIDEIVPVKEGERKRFIQVLAGLIQQETNFFKKINVNQLSTTYGQSAERHLEILKAHNINCIGWSYSVDGLNAFGINNIVLEDGEWKPSTSYENSCIHHFNSVTVP